MLAEETIPDIKRMTRRKYNSEEKFRIVLEAGYVGAVTYAMWNVREIQVFVNLTVPTRGSLQFHVKRTILSAISEIRECEFHSQAVRVKSL